MTDAPRFEKAGRLGLIFAGVAAVALAFTAFAATWEPRRALVSYLVAFVYWVGIAVGTLLLLMTFYAASARWMVVLRRPLEATASSLTFFAVAFVPVALGMARLFVWAGPERYLGRGTPELLERKARWLSTEGFLARAALYFVLWVGVSEILSYWSRRQDQTGDLRLTVLSRRLGAGALPVLGLSMTFAAFDWLMSLDPAWSSTIFGLYWFAGSFLGAHAVLIVIAFALEDRGLLKGWLTKAHYHSLGKLTFAFVVFWAYIAFSQFMLMWIAHLPDEIPWYIDRIEGHYTRVAIFLFFGHFVVPFLILLSKDVKMRPALLSLVALWILLVHYVDIYWLVMPVFYGHDSRPNVTDFTAFVGLGAAATAFVCFRLQGQRVVPVGDPYLMESARYMKP